jgi:hypothetical protein
MAVRNSCTYPDDENSHQQYAGDMAAWEATWGVDVEMSFMRSDLPLTPGTAPLGSHECYGCRKVGNMSKDCPLPEDERINHCERGWCSYVTKILFAIGNHSTPARRPQIPMVAQISIGNEVIEYDPYLYPIDMVSFREVGQGNGLESRE